MGGGGFFSFVMPVVGAVIGSMAFPGGGTALGASLGAGLGGTAGGLADGRDLDASLMQGAVSGATAYAAGNLGGSAFGSTTSKLAGADMGTSFTQSAFQAGAAGAAGATAGSLAADLAAGPLGLSPDLPEYELPAYALGDGLDFLDQAPPEIPDPAEAQAEAARKRALLLTEAVGPVDLVLTSTGLENQRPGLSKKTLLGA